MNVNFKLIHHSTDVFFYLQFLVLVHPNLRLQQGSCDTFSEAPNSSKQMVPGKLLILGHI